MGVGNSSFCSYHCKDWIRQELSIDANSRADFNEKQKIYMVLKGFPTDCLLCAREGIKVAIEKSDTALNWRSKLTSPMRDRCIFECLQI